MSEVTAPPTVPTEESPSRPNVEVPVRRRGGRDQEDAQVSRKRLLVVLPLVMACAAISALVLLGMKDKGLYSKSVDELVKNKSRFAGHPVIADGSLVHGSIMKRERPCEWRFVLERNGIEMPVSFPQCTVPDQFKDVANLDIQVTVEGKLQADDTFVATSIMPKCPSKYMDEAKNGKQMPHDSIAPREIP
jgi:cytochrome c-type biogenesis protein CcmE